MRLTAALRYRPFRRIIAISEAIAAVLRDRGVEDHRIEVIRDAVDVKAFADPADCVAFRTEFSIPESTLVIAAAGQLIPRKGHRYLLEAISELKDTHPPFRLILFGDGHLNNQLRSQAASLGLGDTVQFVGFRDDLDSFFPCFDIFAHPALAEGMGVVTLKAQAAAVPVVGFAAGGLPEAVANAQTGLLVPPEDVGALKDAIAKLIDDDALRRRFGDAGQQRMKNEFSIDTMTDKHISLYENVLND
jgi:glycosyltransferase involved in cell wall biosynthesis